MYGDTLSDGPEADVETPGGGVSEAILIDKTHLVYLLSDSPCDPGTPPRIWANETLQDPSVYVYDNDNDYESTGHRIATITFTTNPGTRRISWSGRGTIAADGIMIHNPIAAITDFFVNHGEWIGTDFDLPSANASARLCDTYGLTIHWVFNALKTYKQWLADILYHILADPALTSAGQLAIKVDLGQPVAPEQIYANLEALHDVVGEDPEDEIIWELDSRNIVNSLTIKYQYSWAMGDYQAITDPPIQDRGSMQFYADELSREISLPGIRSQTHLQAWATAFLKRYALLPATVEVPARSLRHIALVPSTYSTLDWGWGPSALGEGWTDRILKTLNVDDDFTIARQQQRFLFFDLGNITLLQTTYAVLEDQSGGLWYLAVSLDGNPLLSDTIPGTIALNTTPWAWLKMPASLGADWYLYPSPTVQRVEWAISDTQPANGVGVDTSILILISQRLNRWVFRVGDRPELMLSRSS